MENSFDIFLSYDSKDLAMAQSFAQAFSELGFNSFWDRTTILPGVNFPHYLKLSVDNSKLVVVLWSKHSVNSLWVESEARRAQKSAKLIPVFIEDINNDDLPFGLEGIHSVRLSGWDGNKTNAQFRLLMNAIGLRLNGDLIFKSENSVAALKIGHTITMELINNTIIRSYNRQNIDSTPIKQTDKANQLNPFWATLKNTVKMFGAKRSDEHGSTNVNDTLIIEPYQNEIVDHNLMPPPNENDFPKYLLQTASTKWVFDKLCAQSNIINPTIDNVSDKTFADNIDDRTYELMRKALEIGSCRILRCLGTGGMTDVYLVWNPRMEVYRAYKVLLPSITASLGKRFETEIRIVSKMDHQHIAHFYSVGDWYGLPYYEMEYIDGFSIDNFLSKGLKFLPEEAACIIERICIALIYAHSLNVTLYGNVYRGVIHRDLKPSNILLTKGGNIKIIDFGISRPMGVSLHTEAIGSIIGTLPYIAPEQINGSESSIRSDIYSVGLTLFEMLSGVKAFPQADITELIKAKISTTKIKYIGNGSKFDKAIAEIISKSTALEQSERFANAEEMMNALKKAISFQNANVPSILRKVARRYSIS